MSDNLPLPITGPLSDAQRASLLSLVRRAARTEILPRFRKLDPEEVSQKTSPADLVTAADRQAEAMITRGLQMAHPSAVILGEEAAADDEEMRDKLDDAELGFLIDPVDGTWNFAHGLSVFGTMVAATRFGRPVYGLVYDPLNDDYVIADTTTKTVWHGTRGRTRPARTRGPRALNEMVGYIHLKLMSPDEQDRVAALYPEIGHPGALRCSAHEYRLLAMGACDFILAPRMSPWDHAAGVLLCQQAGGHVAFLDGSDYSTKTRSGFLLSAANEETWNRVAEKLHFLSDAADAR